MNIYRLICTALLLCFLTTIQAQDRHFTLYNYSPLTLNPAFTGSFLGTVRVGGIFRDQAYSMSNAIDISKGKNIYLTQSFYVDAPVLTVRKRDWVSVGLTGYTDKAGTSELGSTFFHISGAYHLALDKKQKNVLSLGVQGGQLMRKFNDQAELLGVDGELYAGTTGQQTEASGFDLNAGMLLKAQLNKVTNINIGFSLSHFWKPRQSADSFSLLSTSGGTTPNPGPNPAPSGNVRYVLPTLLAIHGEYNVELTKQWSMSPSFLFQNVANQSEGVVQFMGGYRLLKREVRANGKKGKLIVDDEAPRIRFGLGYRVGDAAQLLLGYEVKTLRVGIGYDLTLSGLNDATPGGFEVAASYIFKVYKKPEVDPVILCPRF